MDKNTLPNFGEFEPTISGYSEYSEHTNIRNLLDCEVPGADVNDSKLMRNENHNIKRVRSVTSVYFRNIVPELCQKILEADVVVGCVAWITNREILKAMSLIDGVQILVQKEDFLRPDSVHQCKYDLLKLYTNLKGMSRYDVTGCQYSCAAGENYDSVRCVGICNTDKSLTISRMHNKFLVFCHKVAAEDSFFDLIPYAVWTGSFNFTYNGTQSLENGVFIESKKIANQYYQEYQLIYGLSEPLNWESKWVAPEYRIGT